MQEMWEDHTVNYNIIVTNIERENFNAAKSNLEEKWRTSIEPMLQYLEKRSDVAPEEIKMENPKSDKENLDRFLEEANLDMCVTLIEKIRKKHDNLHELCIKCEQSLMTEGGKQEVEEEREREGDNHNSSDTLDMEEEDLEVISGMNSTQYTNCAVFDQKQSVEIENLRKEVDHLVIEREANERRFSKIYHEKDEEIKKIKSQCDYQKGIIDCLHSQHDTLHTQLATLRDDYQTLLNVKESYKSNSLHYQKEYNHYQKGEMASLRTDLDTLRNDYLKLFQKWQKSENSYLHYHKEYNTLFEEKKKEVEEKERQKQAELARQPKTEIFIHLASPSYEKDYLPLMENILCTVFRAADSQTLYRKKKVNAFSAVGSSAIPPQGSTVLYVLILSSTRIDDPQKKQDILDLINAGVNVVICLFRTSRVVYLDVEEIVIGGNTVKTIPFMYTGINKKQLSHEVQSLDQNEKANMIGGFKRSVQYLEHLLLRHPPKENWIKSAIKKGCQLIFPLGN